jgi:hypothetical protein
MLARIELRKTGGTGAIHKAMTPHSVCICVCIMMTRMLRQAPRHGLACTHAEFRGTCEETAKVEALPQVTLLLRH